jgi:hypothetical protein
VYVCGKPHLHSAGPGGIVSRSFRASKRSEGSAFAGAVASSAQPETRASQKRREGVIWFCSSRVLDS